MELIIDIPEEVYKSIQDNDYCGILNSDMYNAVKNGTPLPKVIEDIKAEIESICENTTYPPDDTFFRTVADEDYFLGLEYAIKIIDKHIETENIKQSRK